MGKKLTYEYIKAFIENNSKCKLISSYTKLDCKRMRRWLKLECSCGELFEVRLSHFIGTENRIGKTMCDNCSGHIKWDITKMKEVIENNNCELLSTNYIDAHSVYRFKCNCGNIFECSWDAFYIKKQRQCKICSGNSKTHEQHLSDVFKIHKDNIYVIGTYSKCKTKIEYGCKFDSSHTWIALPSNVIKGSGCPYCNQSKGEKIINEWMLINNINFEPQKEFNSLIGLNGGNLSYDFYLLEPYNLLIEYQGEFHDGTAKVQSSEMFQKQKLHDQKKLEYAQDNKINLLEIWYWDFNNIEQILSQYLFKESDLQFKFENERMCLN